MATREKELGASASNVRVITIAVGGATCSGKTTLAKHLRNCLYNSVLIHQDDFAPAQDLIPIHPDYGVQDWDDAPGAIEWPRLATFLQDVKRTGIIPESHKSHDHLNEQREVPVDPEVIEKWKQETTRIAYEHEEKYNQRIVWAIVDGFLLYWDQQVIDQLDVRVFLRAPEAVLKQRRHERHGYHTAVQSDPEGALWRDPPHYWEQIVYPAYIRAHKHIFEGGDVEHGKLTQKVENMLLFEETKIGMQDLVNKVVESVSKALQGQ